MKKPGLKTGEGFSLVTLSQPNGGVVDDPVALFVGLELADELSELVLVVDVGDLEGLHVVFGHV